MGTHTSTEIVRAARELAQVTKAETAELHRLHGENTACLNETTRQRDEEGLRLTLELLPELTPDAITRAVRLTGCVTFTRNDLIAAREEDRRARTAELAELEADPRFGRADHVIGELTNQREGICRQVAPFREIAGRATHPRLNRLIELGYDTPAYKIPFWHLEFYDDWKEGDEILERFPGCERFEQVRVQVLQAWRRIEEADAALAELDRQIAVYTDLQNRAAGLREYLARLDEAHLERAHEYLRLYLLETDMSRIGPCLEAEPALSDAFKRLRGLAAKTLYLERLNEQLGIEIAQLENLQGKAEHDADKWQRPKRAGETLEEADYERRYVVPREKMLRRRERYARMGGALRGYGDYSRVTYAGSILWWDEFTDGRFDGDFIPEVREFRLDHPEYHGPHGFAGDEDAATAEASLLHGTGGAAGGYADAS